MGARGFSDLVQIVVSPSTNNGNPAAQYPSGIHQKVELGRAWAGEAGPARLLLAERRPFRESSMKSDSCLPTGGDALFI